MMGALKAQRGIYANNISKGLGARALESEGCLICMSQKL
jgi:hypothetical protein